MCSSFFTFGFGKGLPSAGASADAGRFFVGAGAAWFGLYAGTSGASKSFKGEDK